jgi:hypothetical protein
LGQRRGLKNPWAGEEDVFLVHPQNDLNGLILNWCTGGCWFTPAIVLGREWFSVDAPGDMEVVLLLFVCL